MGIIIRRAEPEDIPYCIEIAATCPDTASFAAPWFSGPSVVDDPSGRIVVAEEDGMIVGFYACRFKIRRPDISLYYLAVRPDMRQDGIGTLLFEDLKKRWLDSPVHDSITLQVDGNNVAAVQFWYKMGFVYERENGANLVLKLKKEQA